MTFKPIALILAATFAGAAPAQFNVPAVRYVESPQPARIGVGEGVVFRVRAEIDPPHRITGYEWRRNGVAITGAPNAPELRIDSATPADAGGISVVAFSTGISGPTRPVPLNVVNNDWAPLAGRVLSPTAAPHQPSLIRCGEQMVLAWVERVGAWPGVATLRASRYDRATWVPLDPATLAGTQGHHASDPSLGCTWFQNRNWIVLAWTEAPFAGGPKTLHTKRFDDQRWQPVGAPLAASPTVAPSHPVLRMTSEEGDNPGGTLVAKYSLRAYLNAGRMRYERWDGVQWVMLGDGTPHTGAMPQVTLDTATRPTAAGRALVPLQLANQRTGVGMSQLGVSSSHTLWQNVGKPPALDSTSSRQLVGLGFATNTSVPQAAAVWREGSALTLSSAILAGQDYLDAFTAVNPPAPISWAPYAAPLTLNAGSFITAFDREGHRGDCTGKRSFAFALADAINTRVLLADCPPSPLNAPMVWQAVGTPLPNRPVTMALKMQDLGHPVLALVENGTIQVLKWIATP